MFAKKTNGDPVAKPTKQFLNECIGKQPGDSANVARLHVEAVTKSGRCEGKPIPSHLAVRNDAVTFAADALGQSQKEHQVWTELAATTDRDDIVG